MDLFTQNTKPRKTNFPNYKDLSNQEWKVDNEFVFIKVNREDFVVYGRTESEYAFPIFEGMKKFCYDFRVNIKIETPIGKYTLTRSYFDSFEVNSLVKTRGFWLIPLSSFKFQEKENMVSGIRDIGNMASGIRGMANNISHLENKIKKDNTKNIKQKILSYSQEIEIFKGAPKVKVILEKDFDKLAKDVELVISQNFPTPVSEEKKKQIIKLIEQL
jgi:hypothetical protein